MSHEAKLEHLTVDDLAQKCAQETDRYFARQDTDSRYCYELFRRAIQNKDQRALELVFLQYQPLVTRWVERWMGKHPSFSSVTEEVQDFIAQTFERFWISFTPAKLDKSQGLAAVLRYLQMCVNGVLTDAWRKLYRRQLEQEMPEQEQELPGSEPAPEDLLQQEEFWQLIKRKSKDPREYTVIYASFHLALSPREILAEYPDEFSSVKEIYQYKANLLERLERDDEIREFSRRS
jgi:DNA-directed RNA polymerase specialized sigma24 family protein